MNNTIDSFTSCVLFSKGISAIIAFIYVAYCCIADQTLPFINMGIADISNWIWASVAVAVIVFFCLVCFFKEATISNLFISNETGATIGFCGYCIYCYTSDTPFSFWAACVLTSALLGALLVLSLIVLVVCSIFWKKEKE